MNHLVYLAFLSSLALATASVAAPRHVATIPSAQAPVQAVEMISGMSYIVLKPAPSAAKTVSADFVEYRLSAWSADGVLRIDDARNGAQMKPMRQVSPYTDHAPHQGVIMLKVVSDHLNPLATRRPPPPNSRLPKPLLHSQR